MASESSSAAPGSRKRAKASILASFVADAATMPVHWVYNPVELLEFVKASGGDESRPEFLDKSADKCGAGS